MLEVLQVSLKLHLILKNSNPFESALLLAMPDHSLVNILPDMMCDDDDVIMCYSLYGFIVICTNTYPTSTQQLHQLLPAE